jgi:hypothetical protein
MTVEVERRLLQAAVLVACLVPLLAGGAGALQGPDMIRGGDDAGADLDSHFRYLSGLLLGIGLAFLACVPRIERRGSLFRTLGAIAIVGGLARAVSLVQVGPPGAEHQFALAMELGTVPLLMAWQWRVERRCRAVKGDEAT